MLEWAQRSIIESASIDPQTTAKRKGLSDIVGFFSKNYWGDKTLPQRYTETFFSWMILSDDKFGSTESPIRLLVFVTSTEIPRFGLKELRDMLRELNVAPEVLSPDSIAVVSQKRCRPESMGFLSLSVRKASSTPLT